MKDSPSNLRLMAAARNNISATIDHVATDQSGFTATSTRTVVVQVQSGDTPTN